MSEKINMTNMRYGQLIGLYQDNKNNLKWYFQCDCGVIKSINAHNVRSGKVQSCGCLKGKEQTENLVNKKFGLLTVISREYFNNIGKWKCLCKCGNYCYVSTGHLKSGTVKSCGCLSSWKELEIKNLLEQYNIAYISQATFENCLSPQKYKLKFDFFLPDNNICIEYNGSQHYKPYNFDTEKSFAKRQLYDEIKKNYCNQNGIRLLIFNIETDLKEEIKLLQIS